jgi:hypothetical protein
MHQLNKTILFLFLLASHANLNSQNEFSKWYFGTQAGLDFATSPPTVLTNGANNSPEGVATICDNIGNLLFYAQPDGIFNSAHSVMANGAGILGGQSSTQGAIIVKQPGNTNLYYMFTTDQFGAASGARYSVVDMTLAAGLGSVTVKNSMLYTPSCEKLVAVRHCNGRDAWVITHDYNSNQFRTFLLNSTGVVLPPVISAIGETQMGSTGAAIGHLKISPDGKKLAMATLTNSIPSSLGNGGFHLFDFDASTGVITNSLTLLNGTVTATSINTGAYGVEFSQDGTKLYGTTGRGTSTTPTPTCALFQWNICAGNSSAIIASQYSISLASLSSVGSMQRAIDGKIYLAAGMQSLSVINNPNSSGAAMNFVLNGQSIAPKLALLGLPNYINSYTRNLPQPFTNTISCQTTSFSIPPVPTFSSGCSSTPYAPNSYLWNFGEPASGAANTSTLTNPVHTYSTLGTYSVSLTLYSNCTNDTLKKVVTISATNPTLSVAGIFDICKGDKRTYTVTGASSYKWSNNVTTPTTTFAPIATTVYSVTGTVSGCSASKLFTINVNPCLGIAANQISDGFSIYPNPVIDLLSVESLYPASMMIFDMRGKLMQENKLRKGHNEINTLGLKPGIYNLQASDEKGIWRGRLVKIE